MSYVLRRRLQSASTSAVLPDPTGPPIPTRKGWAWESELEVSVMTETTSCIGFHEMRKQDQPSTRLNPDRELLPVQLGQPQPALLAEARQWQAAHRFDPGESDELLPLPSWPGSFAETQAGPRSRESFLSLRELRGRPTTPVQF